MAAIQGQPSPKPGGLEGPVPGTGAQSSFDSFMSSFSAPKVEAPTAQPSGGEQFAQQFSPEAQNENFPVQEPSSVMGVNTDIPQQFKDFTTRLRANLAADPESVKLTLEKSLGKENVKVKNDKLYFKHPDEKSYRELDPATFEVVNDLFADFAKEGIQAMGAAAGGAAGSAGGPAGAFAGTALGAAAGTEAARLAGSGMGVVEANPQSVPERLATDLQEGALFAATEGIFKNLGARFADRRARLAGIRQLEEVAPIDSLREGVKTNLKTLQDLHNLGLTKTIEGTNIEVPAHQLVPFLPKVENVAKSVAAEKAFQQAQKEAAENFSATTMSLVEEAAGITKGRLSEILKTGVPISKGTNSAEIAGLFNSVRREEGKVIGEFRDLAKSTAKKTPLPSPATADTVNNVMRDLGVRMQQGKLIWPDEDALAQTLGTDSKAFIGGLKSDLEMLNNKMIKGGMTIDELVGQSQILGAKNEGARKIGGLYKSAIGRISSSLREDARNAMPLVLDPEDAVNYAASMKRFASVSDSMKQLEGYLQDDVGMSVFARGLVNKGKEGLASLRAAKEFLLQENPAMYNDLIGQYMEELALKHRDPSKIGGFNASGMRKELAGLGSEYLDELFPAKGAVNKSLVLRSFDLSNQIERSIIGAPDSTVVKDARKLVGGLSEFTSAKINAVYALMQFGTKDSRLLKLLSREGVESFLQETPKKNRESMRQTLNAILSLARQNGTLATIDSYVEPTSTMGQVQKANEGTPAQ